jgi:hypothetical protein
MVKDDKPAPLDEAVLEAVTGGVGPSALPQEGTEETPPDRCNGPRHVRG